jgi:hypothetical protein
MFFFGMRLNRGTNKQTGGQEKRKMRGKTKPN